MSESRYQRKLQTHPRRARKEKTRARAIKTKTNSKTQNLSLSLSRARARARVKKRIALKKRTKLSPHPPCSIDRCVRESPNRTIFSRRDVNPISVLLFVFFWGEDVPNKAGVWDFFIFFFGSEISFFPQLLRFSYESDRKNGFSRSRCTGSEPGTPENLAELEMSRIRNEQN